MTLSRIALLPKLIQEMCRASFIALSGLLGLAIILRNVFQSNQLEIVRSLVLGSILWLFPNAYFLIKIMRRLRRASGKALLNVFYRAELLKLLFSGIFFVVIIKLLSINVSVFLLAYLVSYLVFWILLIVKSKEGLL